MSDPGVPDASVIVPTHNRRGPLLRMLDALAAQTVDASRFEVIVVTDACTDDTAAALDAGSFPFAFRHLPSDGRGAAAARNTGAAAARGDRLVFVDDDIIADPGFLAAHLAAGDAAPGAAVIGQSAPGVVAAGWFGRGIHDWWTGRFRDMATPGYLFGYDDVMSGNLSLPRATFATLGGFDRTLLCREDFELGYRLIKAGVPVVYAASARGLHNDASTPSRILIRARNEGMADFLIGQAHPDLFRWLRAANMTAPTLAARVLRMVCFRFPAVARRSIAAGAALAPPLERLRLHRWWCGLTALTRALSYQLGVAAAAGDVDALLQMRRRVDRTARAERHADIDMLDGIDAARAAILRDPPDRLTLRLGDWTFAALHPGPGREPIRSVHLDRLIGDHLRDWALSDRAADFLSALPHEGPDWTDRARDTGNGRVVSLAEIDIAAWSASGRDSATHYPLRALIRRGRQPIGWIYVDEAPPGGQFWQTVRRAVLQDRGICERIVRDAALRHADAHPTPPVSVVVCTRDRTATLRRCLAALLALDYPAFEIIIVDNAPATPDTAELVTAMPGVRYVREDRPGLDWARNRGIAEARHAIVAFTDDDTQVDRHWLTGFAEILAEPAVDFVTGLVVPMTLDTEARRYFEDIYGGMGKGFTAMTRDPKVMWPHDMLWSSAIGVGANMAFRKSVFDRVGAFDPALDVGTATRGGGDIEMFHRALARGCLHVYQPAALVWHEHRADFDGLRRQLADNGSGFAAYLLACLRNRTVPRMAVLRFAARSWIWDWHIKRLLRPGRHRRDFVRAEIEGMLRGPRLWRKAQADARAVAAAEPATGRDGAP